MLNNPAYEKMTDDEIKQVKALRKIIAEDSNLPSRELDENLLIATFNIREFGAKGKKRKGFAINALAEMCSCFDIIAIQELRADLRDLDRMLTVMGPYWKVLFNDPAGKALGKGNDERLAFIYDSRTIKFSGLAAELLITDDFFGKDAGKASMPWRTPYMASFRAGFFDFALLTVHIQWNAEGGVPARAKEIATLTDWVGRQSKAAQLYEPDIFLLGDFNIPDVGSAAFKALETNGFSVPKPIRDYATNLKGNAHYDQIAFDAENTKCTVNRAGVIDHTPAFFKGLNKTDYDAMTFQISDHKPLWMEVRITETNLDQFVKNT